jgi:hypothetical protein
MSGARSSRTSVVHSVLGRIVFLSALALLLPPAILPQSKPEAKAKPEKPSGTTKLRIEVTGGEKNQPVESASVYVKFVQERTLAKDKKFELNLKTNREGVVKVPEVPRGKILIQVVAEGWKPFGRWYQIEEEEQAIKIHLEKPPHWY